MAYSSILGGERAPTQAEGKTAGSLGPSDSSDSGSDSIGELGDDQLASDSDRNGTGERASVQAEQGGGSADILPDRVVRLGGDEDGVNDSAELADLDDGSAGADGE
jgi:hypothetical protein